ncbi:ParB N-terminal domain-containing protein [Leucobacter chromiireducens]|uniref:ParB N-terminal domain-containing protein n=1 Tax=Leucobacter chromiireducens TaxID=283877 RepID=UPI000F633060|nr:ParB N-terminal domain-containing protein [Leucobacter chromiireducens]
MAGSSPGHIELERALDSIVVGTRHRTDLGDIDALMDSISRVGLLQPITLTPDGVLVCGWRRYHALRRLGHRTTNVWIRSGLTDRLSQLLAEQDDAAMHKPLSLIEAESLYRELKAVMTEDAARRQEASRFGSATREAGDAAEVSGAVESTAPRSAGEARVQAARMVTGRGSQTMLEQIGRLKDLANDDTRPEHIRAQAAEELARIEAGGKVYGSHLRMNAALSLDELDRLAADPDTPEMVRVQAATSATEVRAAGREARTAELAQLAADAVARITAAKRAGKKRGKPEARPRLARVMLPPRAFLALWADLDGWTTRYDAAEIARTLTAPEWERVERVLAETVAFLAIIRDLRTEAAEAANDAAAEPRRIGVRAG